MHVYLLTSPPALAHHVVLRKLYSVVAFAVVSWLARVVVALLGLRQSPLTPMLAGASFSGTLEISQRLGGSPENLASNLFDVACGALGGALATVIPVPAMLSGLRSDVR